MFNDLNGNRLYHGPQELGALLSATGGVSTTLTRASRRRTPTSSTLSYQRQFWGQSSIRVAYVRKMTRDQYATFNLSREGQFTVPVTSTVTLNSVDKGVTAPRRSTCSTSPRR